MEARALCFHCVGLGRGLKNRTDVCRNLLHSVRFHRFSELLSDTSSNRPCDESKLVITENCLLNFVLYHSRILSHLIPVSVSKGKLNIHVEKDRYTFVNGNNQPTEKPSACFYTRCEDEIIF